MKLAVAQMLVEGGHRDANLTRAESAIAGAAHAGADLVVLPEALDCGWTHPCARQLATPIPDGAAARRLATAAQRGGIHVCAGIVERAGDSLYNAALLFSPRGELLLHHRKIYELEIARDLYTGGNQLQVAQTEFGTVAVMICADAFAPDLCISRTLAVMGARLIVSPCAWAVPADHDQANSPYGSLWKECYGAVAREYSLHVAGASNVGLLTAGPWAGRKCIGCSLVVGPGGEPLVEGPYGEDAATMLFLDLPIRDVSSRRIAS